MNAGRAHITEQPERQETMFCSCLDYLPVDEISKRKGTFGVTTSDQVRIAKG